MVDAQATVAFESEVAVVPPAKTLGRVRKQPVAVGQAQCDQCTQVVALFLGAVDGVAQAFGVPDISVVKGNVVVTHQHQPGVLCQFFLDPAAQGTEPLHLVLKLVAARLLPVGEVGANHPHAIDGAGDHTRHVIVKTGNVLDHIGRRCAREQGHAVVGFLPKPRGRVACSAKGIYRKLVVGEFEFLQGQHIDRMGCKPIQHLGKAHAQRVHVPGGKFHGASRV